MLSCLVVCMLPVLAISIHFQGYASLLSALPSPPSWNALITLPTYYSWVPGSTSFLHVPAPKYLASFCLLIFTDNSYNAQALFLSFPFQSFIHLSVASSPYLTKKSSPIFWINLPLAKRKIKRFPSEEKCIESCEF